MIMLKADNIRSSSASQGICASVRAEVPAVLSLALPIIIGLTASTLVGVADTIMIAPLGTASMAAASLTTSFMIILYTVVYGVISIVHARIAQAEGASDAKGVASAMRNGLVLAMMLGAIAASLMALCFPALAFFGISQNLLDALLPYWVAKSFVIVPFAVLSVFRGLFNTTGRPWVSTSVAFAAVAINVPLNFVLIHGAFGFEGLGLLGAGLGSVVAQAAALVVAYGYFHTNAGLSAYRQAAAIKTAKVLSALKEGVPVAVGNLGEGGAYAVAGLLLGFYGAVALAANQVVHAVAAIMYMLPMGMTSAVAIRIGQAYGAGELHRLRPISLAATGIVLLWMGAFFTFLLLFREDVARALSDDPAVISLASLMFLTVAFSQFADGLQSTSLGALRGLLDVRVPTLITVLAYWAVGLPIACLLAFTMDFGPNGVWIGYGLGILISAIALQTRFWMMTTSGRLSE